jgi:hypothetical protein
MKRHSIFSRTGLPEAFGVVILTVGFALLVLTPWLSGVSVASLKLPELPAEVTSLLRIVGLPAFVILCLLFVPIRRDRGLAFVSINIDRSDPSNEYYWREGECREHHDKISRRATQYFQMTVFESDSDFWKEHQDPVNKDPVFDITVKHYGSDTELILQKVGIIVLEVANTNYLWGSPAKEIEKEADYIVETPNLRERLRDAYEGFDLEPRRLDEVVSIDSRRFEFEAKGTHRYTLRLNNFCENMPNHVRLRMWCETDYGQFSSDEIALLRY